MTRAIVLALLLTLAAAASAHEVRPAYLRIQQLDTESFDVLFRVPARGAMRLAIYVELPE